MPENPIILLIDDEPEFVGPHVEALELAGYQVIRDADPDTALERLKRGSEKIDLIILDLLMPSLAIDSSQTGKSHQTDMRKTGVRMHHEIRVVLKKTDIPIVFLSVVRDPQIRAEIDGLEKRFGNRPQFLNKPALPSELVEMINKSLNKKRG